jgi:hypothetical protein
MHSQVTVWIETLISPGLFELVLIATGYALAALYLRILYECRNHLEA